MKTPRLSALVCLALIVPSLAPPALAQDVSATQPKTIVAALQSLGYRAEVGTDDLGVPLIYSGVSGVNYTVFLHGCEGVVNCTSIEFQSLFALTTPTTIEVMNEWNRQNLFGTALTTANGEAMLSYAISTVGGLSPENFEDVTNRWTTSINTFKTAIGY